MFQETSGENSEMKEARRQEVKETLLREGGEERRNEEEDGGEKIEVCPVKPSDR